MWVNEPIKHLLLNRLQFNLNPKQLFRIFNQEFATAGANETCVRTNQNRRFIADGTARLITSNYFRDAHFPHKTHFLIR